MDKRVLKIIGLLAALMLVFVIGAAAGGGVVFAANKAFDPAGLRVAAPAQSDPEPGVVVASVAPNSPAAEAGVKRGDILLEIDGEAVDSSREMTRYLLDREPGDDIELKLLHGDDERILTATLGNRDGRPYLGVTPCSSVSAEPAMMLLRLAQPGALIVEVVPGSPAEDAGLEAGDFISAVDEQELGGETDLADLIGGYAPGDTVTLQIGSPGEETREVSVELGEHPKEAGAAYLGVQYQPAPTLRQFGGGRIPFNGPHLEMPQLEGPHLEMPQLEDEFLFELPEGDFDGGAVVARVAEDSPADGAGLKRGDIITALDGEALDDPQTLVDAVDERQPGEMMRLTMYRPGVDEPLVIDVTLAEHPEDDGTAYLGVFLGRVFTTRNFDRELGLPGMRDGGRWFGLEIPLDPDNMPFDLENAPHWFQFETPDDDCCDDGSPNEA